MVDEHWTFPFLEPNPNWSNAALHRQEEGSKLRLCRSPRVRRFYAIDLDKRWSSSRRLVWGSRSRLMPRPARAMSSDQRSVIDASAG